MTNENFELYKEWLGAIQDAAIEHEKVFAQDSFSNDIKNSSAYQKDATRNGEPQPLAATRTESKKCSITIAPGDEMYIGDLVHVFNEDWLCIEVYIDELGMRRGEIWMCNQKFRYQDKAGNIYEKLAIMDDGSYSKGDEKAIPVTSTYFVCYMSLEDDTRKLYVDKRLAVDTLLDSNENPILEVGKIVWIDAKSNNYGEGSHLLAFGLGDDIYSKEKDSLEEMICDYISPGQEEPPTEVGGYVSIDGRNTIRVGTTRTYTAEIIEADGTTTAATSVGLEWSCDNPLIKINPSGTSCSVGVPLNDDLIGETIKLTCTATDGTYAAAEKEVGVIAIG